MSGNSYKGWSRAYAATPAHVRDSGKARRTSLPTGRLTERTFRSRDLEQSLRGGGIAGDPSE